MVELKLKYLFPATLVALAFSCGREEAIPDTSSTGMTITASWGGSGQKTVIGEDPATILWSPNDEISVFYNEDGLRFTSLNSTPVSTATFICAYGVILANAEGGGALDLYGVYPYSDTNEQVGETLVLDVPGRQTAVAGSFGRGAFPAVGHSSTRDITFYNVCGGIRFTLSENGISKVRIYGNSGEEIAGRVKVNFDDARLPAVTEIVRGEKEVILSAPSGGTFRKGEWYYVSLLPTSFSNGFTFEFIKRADGSERASRRINGNVSVKRSVFGSLKNIDTGMAYKVGIASLPVTPSKVAIRPGSSVKLSYSILPSDAEYEWVRWSSSDPSVASVDNTGRVTAHTKGECVVSVSSDNGTVGSCVVYSQYYPLGLVDLGLSVYWAECNLGADFPTDCGGYYSWGETSPKTNFSWNNYSLCKTYYNKLLKYIARSSYGTVDNKKVLEKSDDAATAMFGAGWRMPRKAEWDELIERCTWTWTNVDSVYGYEVSSPVTGKSIFLPVCGMFVNTSLEDAGQRGYYWSSELSEGFNLLAWGVCLDPYGVTGFYGRSFGRTIRPVFDNN